MAKRLATSHCATTNTDLWSDLNYKLVRTSNKLRPNMKNRYWGSYGIDGRGRKEDRRQLSLDPRWNTDLRGNKLEVYRVSSENPRVYIRLKQRLLMRSSRRTPIIPCREIKSSWIFICYLIFISYLRHNDCREFVAGACSPRRTSGNFVQDTRLF